MRVTTLILTIVSVVASQDFCGTSTNTTAEPACQFSPSTNATTNNYPGSLSNSTNTTTSYPYNITDLSSVPIATICYKTSTTPAELLACARKYIDAIDEQLAFLHARRLGYAAVAGDAKFSNATALNDPTRNTAVAEGMAARVAKYGASKEAGRVLGGEGCMIYASLEYEKLKIEEDCGGNVTESVERVC